MTRPRRAGLLTPPTRVRRGLRVPAGDPEVIVLAVVSEDFAGLRVGQEDAAAGEFAQLAGLVEGRVGGVTPRQGKIDFGGGLAVGVGDNQSIHCVPFLVFGAFPCPF